MSYPRLLVMDHGTFAAEGSPRDLITRYCSPEVLELRFDPQLHDLAADKLKDFPAERAEVLADRSPRRLLAVLGLVGRYASGRRLARLLIL